MQDSYIPKGEEKDFCEGINLCTVRKNLDGISKIGIKTLDGEIKEILLSDVINSDDYEGKKIIRSYASGHVFLSEDLEKVFLVTTSKDGKTQYQFTGGSPMEDENKDVIIKQNGVYRFDLEKVRANAKLRTLNRTGAEIIEEYNEVPLVDWVLMENEENGEVYFRLVCLMHFIVKKYIGELGFTGKEYALGADWYIIDNLQDTQNVSPNAYIVSKDAQRIVKSGEIF